MVVGGVQARAPGDPSRNSEHKLAAKRAAELGLTAPKESE